MKNRLPSYLIAIFFALTLPFSAQAQELLLNSKSQVSRNVLAVGGDFSSFAFEGGEIKGSGVKATFSHYFNDRMGADLFLMTALQSAGSSSFNGFGMYGHYSIINDCCASRREINFQGQTILEEKRLSGFRVQAGLGVNQILFNGTSGVYSMSGPGVMVKMFHSLWRIPFYVGLEYVMVTNGDIESTGTSISFGLPFSL